MSENIYSFKYRGSISDTGSYKQTWSDFEQNQGLYMHQRHPSLKGIGGSVYTGDMSEE
jgi:hypothetical protein